VLKADEARELLDSIDTATLISLRDRASIAVMVDSFARVTAAVGMEVDDYYAEGRRAWFRLHGKGGKRHGVPAHHNAETYLDAYNWQRIGHIAVACLNCIRWSTSFDQPRLA
jgi:integrase/recombinase XerD